MNGTSRKSATWLNTGIVESLCNVVDCVLKNIMSPENSRAVLEHLIKLQVAVAFLTKNEHIYLMKFWVLAIQNIIVRATFHSIFQGCCLYRLELNSHVWQLWLVTWLGGVKGLMGFEWYGLWHIPRIYHWKGQSVHCDKHVWIRLKVQLHRFLQFICRVLQRDIFWPADINDTMPSKMT